jgi:hypothetical protein
MNLKLYPKAPQGYGKLGPKLNSEPKAEALVPEAGILPNRFVVLNPCRGSHIGTFVSRGSNFSYLYNSSETPAAPAFR